MNKFQKECLEQLQRMNPSIDAREVIRSTIMLPQLVLFFEEEQCSSFMAYIPAFTEDEASEIIDGKTVKAITYTRLIMCLNAEKIKREDNISISKAWERLETQADDWATIFDNPTK